MLSFTKKMFEAEKDKSITLFASVPPDVLSWIESCLTI